MAEIRMIKFLRAFNGDTVYFLDVNGDSLWTKETPEEIIALIKEGKNDIL